MKSTSTYDSFGQRAKYVTGTSTVTTTFYPSKGYNSSTVGASSTSTKHIFLGDMLIATIVGSNASSTVYYAHTDHLGGASVVTSDTPAVVQLLDYYPYGSRRLNEGTDVSQREYIGEMYDEATALNYLNARYMSSVNGKFISQDPMFWDFDSAWLADPQNQNSYSYARNNPLTNLDPTGLYNIKSGEVEKGDTHEGIVNSINSAFGIKIDWQTVSNISFYNDRFGNRALGDIVGENLYIGTEITTDITNQLNDLNKNRADVAGLLGKGSLSLYAPKMPWDLKNSGDPVLGGGATHRQYWSYIYIGELIRYDAPGNINFGYVASSFGLPGFVIQGGARAQQIIDDFRNDHPVSGGDNSGDSQYIQKGINNYKAQAPWWKKIWPW